jgi:hypothetical protein
VASFSRLRAVAVNVGGEEVKIIVKKPNAGEIQSLRLWNSELLLAAAQSLKLIELIQNESGEGLEAARRESKRLAQKQVDSAQEIGSFIVDVKGADFDDKKWADLDPLERADILVEYDKDLMRPAYKLLDPGLEAQMREKSERRPEPSEEPPPSEGEVEAEA